MGLTATKKIGHAVQRNRARRVMKAAIDEHLDQNIGGYDLVFVARGMTPRLKSWQLSEVVARLFAQAGLPDKAKQPGRKTVNPVSRVCRNALCAPIRFYQRFISPGLGRNCRFTPTCSQYGIEAIQTHGCIKGLLLTAWRIARCNPLGRWGFDPVPPKGRWVSPERRLSPAKLFRGRHG